jgi:hypothetical protein
VAKERDPGSRLGDACVTYMEINEAVARKLRWMFHDCERLTISHWHYPAGQHCEGMLPLFISSIAAAWEVVEFVKTPKRMIEIWAPHGDAHWVCNIHESHELISGAGADTAPMAICLAFLKLP